MSKLHTGWTTKRLNFLFCVLSWPWQYPGPGVYQTGENRLHPEWEQIENILQQIHSILRFYSPSCPHSGAESAYCSLTRPFLTFLISPMEDLFSDKTNHDLAIFIFWIELSSHNKHIWEEKIKWFKILGRFDPFKCRTWTMKVDLAKMESGFLLLLHLHQANFYLINLHPFPFCPFSQFKNLEVLSSTLHWWQSKYINN